MITVLPHRSTRHWTARRPLLMLLCATLILAVSIVLRLTLLAGPSRSDAPAVAVAPSLAETVAQLQEKVRRNPEDSDAYAELGLALLQEVRERADPTFYTQAQSAFDNALQRQPQQLNALVGQGILALARHDFKGALVWADKAWAINPFRAQILGIKVDGEVELGRYEEAVQTLQKMVDLRPDLESYSRISYLRELYGDVDGATEAMRSAVQTALPGSESWAWTLTHLGNLYFNRGDLDNAAMIYEQVLAAKANYPYAMGGKAHVAAAQGHTDEAIALYKQITERLPLPEFIIALGELYEATGQPTAAQQQYDLVGVIQQLNVAAGINVDLEMALFTANHGNKPQAAVQQARTAYAERATIYAADTLAWALYQQGEYTEAWQYSQEALRLGAKDAMLHFHAGMIAAKLGDKAAARTHLQTALAINPHFSPLYGPIAQEQLASLTAQ